MSSILLPLRRSDSNLPSTSNAFVEQDHEMYALPYIQRSQPYGQHSSRKKANHRHQNHHHQTPHQHQHRHHSHQSRHQYRTERTPSENDSLSHRDDDDLFASTATNLLSSLKQPSKMTFNWSRQFNETLATISGLLQRNFQENPYPGCNVSEASASTATLGSTTQLDALSKAQADKWQKNRRTSLTGGDPCELDILVLEKSHDGDDSDDY